MITAEDLESVADSPYNTRKYPGLPPGPIESPGDDSIQAALHPADGPWLWYVTVNLKTGETKFTDDYDKFLEFKDEYQEYCETSDALLSMSRASLRCAVLGDPIDHSLSPVIHRAAYDALGLDGWQYDAVQVAAGGLAGFLDGLDPAEWRGLSLTMPLKREAVPLLGLVRRVGARDRRLQHGAARAGRQPARAQHRRDRCPDGAQRARRARCERAVVLGGGATATSLLLALAERGMRHATLVVRDPDRAAETVARGGGAPHRALGRGAH